MISRHSFECLQSERDADQIFIMIIESIFRTQYTFKHTNTHDSCINQASAHKHAHSTLYFVVATFSSPFCFCCCCVDVFLVYFYINVGFLSCRDNILGHTTPTNFFIYTFAICHTIYKLVNKMCIRTMKTDRQ